MCGPDQFRGSLFWNCPIRAVNPFDNPWEDDIVPVGLGHRFRLLPYFLPKLLPLTVPQAVFLGIPRGR
jgi:hypothetical protein